MVSKVAVMALVGIFAVPILLGYGLNLTETVVNDYQLDNDPVNVTELLYNRTAYSSTQGNPYQLNTNFTSGTAHYPIWPVYTSTSNNLSSLPLKQSITQRTNINWTLQMADYKQYSAQMFYNVSIGHVDVTVTFVNAQNNTVSNTLTHIFSVFYDKNQNQLWVSSYPGHSSVRFPDPISISFSTVGSQSITLIESDYRDSNNSFVDLAKGYYFYEPTMTDSFIRWDIKMPEMTNNAILNVNLDSITDSDYKIRVSASPFGETVTLQKTTTNGIISWKAILPQTYGDFRHDEEVIDLMYSPNINNNTYQIKFAINNTWEEDRHNIHYYVRSVSVKFSYVGVWPQQFGNANYYTEQTTEREYGRTTPYDGNFFDSITFSNGSSDNIITKSPVIRVDSASFSGFEYQVINNVNYDPSIIKTNPSTTLSNPIRLGSSLSFAGNTYNIESDGNITLGTHKVSVNGLVFDSVPVAVGYENRINGYVVNISADPATITFNGNWDVTVNTDSASVTTWNKTEWVPGQFAWDGIDTNFLIAGLVTSLGVFVALGIYIRRTKASLWPLLIVCGCSAALFFIMI